MNIERPTHPRRASTCPPLVDRTLNEGQKINEGERGYSLGFYSSTFGPFNSGLSPEKLQ